MSNDRRDGRGLLGCDWWHGGRFKRLSRAPAYAWAFMDGRGQEESCMLAQVVSVFAMWDLGPR